MSTYSAIHDRAAAQEAMRLNICLQCGKDKEPFRTKRWYCRKCGNQIRRARQAKQKEERRQEIGQPTSYAGTIRCLGCRKVEFYSEDRRRITRCPTCQARLYRQEDALVCDEQRYDTEDPEGPNARHQLTRHIGRQINSWDFKAMVQLEQKENYVGIPFRRLTRREIAETYTPEKIAALLVQAKKNTVVGWVPDERSL